MTAPAAPAPPAVVHLWAVDEGILQTTDYATPDPRAHFLAARRLEVDSADVFSDLLPDYRRPATMSRIGGDGGDEEDLRRSPVPTHRREAAIVWRTSAAVGEDGTLTTTLDLPKLSGELRLMAVAVAGDRYGATQQAVTLTTPLLVEATWPRFAAPDDRFQVPVKVFNTTAEPLDVTLRVAVTGPVALDWPAEGAPVAVAPGVPQTVWLNARATGMGQVSAATTAAATTSAGEVLTETAEAAFPVRPVAPLHTEVRFLRVPAGEERQVELPGDFLPGTARATLTVAARPRVELLPALDQLLDYPYGCVEQTTSRLYALLYAPDLLAARGEGAGRAGQVGDMIDAGLLRLWSMQTRDGGLSYWPGSPQSELWPSAYVGDFLLSAERAGHKADARFIEELLKYLRAGLYADGAGAPDDNTRALLAHVLAGFNQPQEGWLARLAERLDCLDTGDRAHLAAAWLELGRKDRALAALPDDTVGLAAIASTGGRITSQTQQEATLLALLLDLDPQHPWIPELVRRLEAARHDGRWGNTLENATALAALARYQASGEEPAEFTGSLAAGGAPDFAFDAKEPTTFRFAVTGDPVRIASRGTGSVYVAAQVQGLMAGGAVEAFDRQLRIRRYWTDRAGGALDPAKLHVGDLVYVKVALEAPSLAPGADIHNVAIVDALPGGTEVEHPRLATSAGVNSHARQDEDATPERVEFRDDRVILFTSAERKALSFRYVLRVIAAGRFAIPPIEASCMYDSAYASLHGGGTLEVAR